MQSSLLLLLLFPHRLLLWPQNKTDLVEPHMLHALKHRLRQINTAAEIIECQYSKWVGVGGMLS